jgi:predicted nucleic acid-binding protein
VVRETKFIQSYLRIRIETEADAAHVAFVEIVGAEFISCDDKLVKKCKKYKIKIWCGNPIDFCVKEDLK